MYMDIYYFSELNRYSRLFNDVVKYNPQGYDENGTYILNEWTDFSDVNKRINHKKLTAEEYLNVETNYVDMAVEVCYASGCKFMTMILFQCWINEPDNILDFDNSLATEKLIKSIRVFDTKRYSISQFKKLLRLALRGYINCVFVNLENKVQIDIGYDFYMHILALRLPYFTLQNMASSHGLYLNPRRKNLLSQSAYEQIKAWLIDKSCDYELKHCDFFCQSDALETSWEVFYSCLEIIEYLNSDYRVALQVSLCEDMEDKEINVLSLLKNNRKIITDMSVCKFKSHNAFDSIGFMSPMNLTMNTSYYSVYKTRTNGVSKVYIF